MRDHIFALTLIVLISLVLCYPGMGGMNGATIATEDSDIWNTMWLTKQATRFVTGDGDALSANSALGFPDDLNLWPHLGGVVWPALLAPLTNSAGPIYTQNFAGILALILTALAAYLFFSEISGDAKPALFAAICFGCGLYGMEEIRFGNPELAAFAVVPLAAFATVRMFDRGGAFYIAFAGATAALAFSFNPYFGLTAFAFLVFAAFQAAIDSGVKVALGRALPALALGITLSIPAAWPIIRSMESAAFDAAAAASVDPASASWDLLEPFFFTRPYPRTISYLLLLVALAGLYKAPKGYRFWLLAGGSFFLLALGPVVHILGHSTGIPGPAAILGAFPGGWRVRFPYRFAIGFHLCLGTATAINLRRFLESADEIGFPHALVGRIFVAIAAIATLVAVLPNAARPVRSPEVYSVLTEHSEAGAVLELPVTRDFYTNSRWLFHQSRHGRPILGGQPLPDLPNPFDRSYFGVNTLLDVLLKPMEDLSIYQFKSMPDPALDVESMTEKGIAFAVVHRRVPGADIINDLCLGAFGEPVYSDETESLYRVGPNAKTGP